MEMVIIAGDSDKRFRCAVELFEEAHREDEREVCVEGKEIPYGLHYHRRMGFWLDRLRPEASEALRLAVRCQHIRRWRVPRDSYPEGKLGYKKWRSDLAVFHGEEAATILAKCAYGGETVERVKKLLLKENLKSDPDTQALEDCACLVFLENEFAAFAEKHDEEKLMVILRKTWKKMSPGGHEEALKLAESLPEHLQGVVSRAIS